MFSASKIVASTASAVRSLGPRSVLRAPPSPLIHSAQGPSSTTTTATEQKAPAMPSSTSTSISEDSIGQVSSLSTDARARGGSGELELGINHAHGKARIMGDQDDV